MIRLLLYIGIKCNKNKILVRCINRLKIEAVHGIMERLKLITHISADIFV